MKVPVAELIVVLVGLVAVGGLIGSARLGAAWAIALWSAGLVAMVGCFAGLRWARHRSAQTDGKHRA